MSTDSPTDLARLISAARSICVLTGAGISTESGISDYRGPTGLWRRNPGAARLFNIDAYRSDPEVRVQAWQMRLDSEMRTAAPNEGHRALAQWETADRRVTVVTQNIDGLHQAAGSTSVLELHGTFWQSRCLDCGDERPIDHAFARLEAGEPDPDCERCGGILRTATIAFGQSLDPAVLEAAWRAAAEADLMLAIGSTLQVQPAASLCEVAVSAGVPLAILNADPTPYDGMASAVLHNRIGPVLSAVAQVLDH